MTDILDEILNDEREEKRLRTFRRIFPAVIIAIVVTALGIASYSWFSAVKTRNNQEAGDLFVQLISGDYRNEKLVVSLFEEMRDNGKNRVAELAALQLVSRQAQTNNIPRALELLVELVNNKKYSEITSAYARILYITLILDVDNLTAEQAIKAREYLQHFTKESQLFYATATLLKSLFHIKEHQPDLGRKYALEVLKLARASSTIKEQAKAIINHLSLNNTSN